MSIIFFIFAMLSSLAEAVECRHNPVVLVPGFFNFPKVKWTPQTVSYFSPNIVRTIEKTGRKVFVFDNLDPVGSVAVNAQKTASNLIYLSQKNPKCRFDVIAHSAGGLYVAQALSDNPHLPIQTVVTISTPYQGVDLIQASGQVPGWDLLTTLLNLQGLAEFSPLQMNKILGRIVIPERVRWVAMAAKQETCFLFSCSQAQNLSWVLTFVWKLFDKEGDGIVSLESALLTDQVIVDDKGKPKTIERLFDFIIPLEHWEIVLDSKIFRLLGVNNPNWLKEQQATTFQFVVEQL